MREILDVLLDMSEVVLEVLFDALARSSERVAPIRLGLLEVVSDDLDLNLKGA